ncbi:uncharacterized protein LOC135483288 isoform X2 [Lineus longissimus]|uniref:uncharacterized protein LOC135483288 isoform X2 n=1 Tax=Lineus longissimus TaxID=88925 RepID=UPI002B4F6BBB
MLGIPYVMAVALALLLALPTSYADTLAEDTCPSTRNSITLFPNAQAMLVGIFDLSQPGRNGEACGEPTPTILPSYEAVMWALTRLNQNNGSLNSNPITDSYVPGIQIGMRAYDTCSRTEVATRSVMDSFPNFYSNARFCTQSKDKMLLGVLGSSYSYVSRSVADWLTAYKMPMVSYASSFLDLGDKTQYPYFMRTIPPDRMQTQVFIEVLKKLKWSYIGIVYTDETYGKSVQAELVRHASQNGICIRAAVSVSKDEKDPVKLAAVFSTLLGVNVTGVIYVGLPHVAFDLMKVAPTVMDAGKLQWIFSDTVGNSRGFGSLNNYTRGYIGLTPSSRRTPEFQDHWMRIDENNPLSYNPFFKDWYMSMNKCKLTGVTYEPYRSYPACRLMSQDDKRKSYVQNQYVLSALDAVYTYARALRMARADKCTTKSGACQALLDMSGETFFKDYLLKVNITYATEERLYAWASYLEEPYYAPKKTFFTTTGEIGLPSYDVWNFNKRPSGLFSSQRVGVYEGGKFTKWDQKYIKMYDVIRENELKSIPPSKCSSDCGTCLTIKGATQFLYIPGNIHITGIFSIHTDATNSNCGKVRLEYAQLMEAFAFAIDRVKIDNPKWLNKVTLGAVGFDDCSSVSRAKGVVANFHNNQLDLRNPATSQKIHPNSVEGYVASSASDTTISIAEILTPLRITQVGYAATSTELSNKGVYPYFLRTVPSDDKQVTAMIRLLKEMSWKYVQTIQAPTSYGKNAVAEFLKQAKPAGICVTASHEFTSHGSYLAILERLRQRPQAKVVIVFADTADINGFLKAVKVQNAGGEFLLFGGELWGTSPLPIVDAENVAVGSLTMKLRSPFIAEFDKYLRGLKVNANSRNPFYREWYQATFNCYIDVQSTTVYPKPCNTTLTIPDSPMFYQSQFAYYTINAVYAIAMGLDEALKFYCGSTYTSICKEFVNAANKKQLLFDKIKAADFLDIDKKTFKFIDGEGNAEYEVHSYWGNGTGKGYQKVASYVVAQNDWGQKPDKSKIHYYNNNPIISECSSGLACQSCLSKFQTKFLHIPGDVLLAGLFPIHNSGSNIYSCGGMKPFNGFQYLETMAFAVDQVNNGLAPVKLQNVTLGAVGLDDCSSEYLASSLVSSIHSGTLLLSKNGITVDRQKIRGLLTYGSGMSIKVQEIVRGLRMAQISPSSTSTRLNDPLLYPMFYRTVPMDDTQVRAIARLVKTVKWSCVQTVHSPTIYAKDAILAFKAAAKAEKICVSACYELFTDGTYDQIIQKLADSSTKAVVVFAQADTYVRNLLEALRQAKLNKTVDLTFIASESWGQLKAVVRGYESVVPNTMTMKVQAPKVPGFDTYVQTLRVTTGSRPNRNPWFNEYYQMIFDCYLTDKSLYSTKCASTSQSLTTSAKYEQENWVVSTMDGVYAFTAALHTTLQQVCGNNYSGVCSTFVQDDDINLKIFRNLQGVSFTSPGGGTFTFNANRARTTGYDVAKVDATNSANPYKEVGKWGNNALTVSDPTLSTSYTSVPSRCAPCIECPYGQQARDKEKFAYLNGDILIANVVDVHVAGKEAFSCGQINMEFGAPLVEVFNFAIEQVNKKQGIFANVLPGVSLGGITVDSCKSAVRAGNLVADFHSGVITLQDAGGQVVEPDRVQLWIGGQTTPESIEMAEVLKILGIPQISYGATGYALSDRDKYPNFLRTVPADDKQARGLISFVKTWNLVNVQLVSSPDPYGNYMSREFIRLAKVNGICITNDIVFQGNGTFTESLADEVVQTLLKNPEASVVLVLLRDDYVNGFLRALDRGTGRQRKFFLIGTDTWGDLLRQTTGVSETILLNAVTFNVETADIPEFDTYLDAKNPNNYFRNPWFNEMYEAAFDCTIPNNIASYARTCSNTQLGIPRLWNYTQDPFALYMENAVYSAAIGIHHALTEICGENYVGACPDYVVAGEKRQRIRHAMKLVNFIDATGQPFKFVLNGESVRGYHIYRLEKEAVGGNLTYKNIGSYNDTNLLKLDITYNPNWFSNCSDNRCKACPNLVPKLSRFMQRRSYRDLNLVAFYNVHHSGSNYLGCGKMNIVYGFQRMLAFFYAIELINNNTLNELDSTMKLSGLAIDFCENPAQLRQDLFTYLNGDGLCNYANYTEMLYPWTSVAYMTTGAAYSIIGDEFFTPLGLTAISPIATAVDLSDKNLHPFFLRTVPPDTLQARAMDEILNLFGWNYFMGVNTDDEYGRGAMEALVNLVSNRGNKSYCVGARHTIPKGASMEQVKEIVRDLDRKRFGRVVILFTNVKDTRKILQATKDLNLIGRFIWLGSESWATDANIPRGLEDVARGAITLEIRSEPVPGFVKWMKEITIKNTKNIPIDWLQEYLQHMFKCRIESSIVVQTQYARMCTDNERILDFMIEPDPAILHTIISAYVVAWGLSSARNKECKGEAIDDCLWRVKRSERNRIIYESLRAAQLRVLPEQLKNDSFQFKFTEQGYGDLGYSIYNYVRRPGSKTDYIYKKVGFWMEELEMPKTSYQGYSETGGAYTAIPISTCPRDVKCACLTGGTGTSTIVERLYPPPAKNENYHKAWGVAAATLSGLGISIALIMFFYFLFFYPVRGGTSVLGYLLLFGCVLVYATNFAFLFHACPQVCAIRKFSLGISYSFCFAALLTKALNTVRVDTYDDRFQAPYKRFTHPLGLFSIATGIAFVQIIIATEWLILRPPDMEYVSYLGQSYPRCAPSDFYNEELLLSLVYPMFLIAMTLFFSALTWRSEDNCKESRWILVASFFCAACWLIWTIVSTKTQFKYRDGAVVVGNIICASLMLICIYARKIHFFNKYQKEKKQQKKEEREMKEYPDDDLYGNVYESVPRPASERGSKYHA